MKQSRYQLTKYRKGLINSIQSIMRELSCQEVISKPDIDFLKSQLQVMSDKDYTTVMSFVWSNFPNLYETFRLNDREFVYKGVRKIRTGYSLRLSVQGGSIPYTFYITHKDRETLVRIRYYIKSKVLKSEALCPPGIIPIKSEKEFHSILTEDGDNYTYNQYRKWIRDVNFNSNKYKNKLSNYLKIVYM